MINPDFTLHCPACKDLCFEGVYNHRTYEIEDHTCAACGYEFAYQNGQSGEIKAIEMTDGDGNLLGHNLLIPK